MSDNKNRYNLSLCISLPEIPYRIAYKYLAGNLIFLFESY
jgi:hypothetical protein